MIQEFNENSKAQEFQIKTLLQSLKDSQSRQDRAKKDANDTGAKYQQQISLLQNQVSHLKQSLAVANVYAAQNQQLDEKRKVELDLYKEKIKTKKLYGQIEQVNSVLLRIHQEKDQVLAENKKLKNLLKMMEKSIAQ